jgi:hypothetical protein
VKNKETRGGKVNWETFDKEILTPYQKNGEDAGMYFSYANVYTYIQIRHIALLAFKAGKDDGFLSADRIEVKEKKLLEEAK